MAKSITENTEISFRIALDTYKHLKGYSDKQIAEVLGCGEKTITKMRTRPLEVSSRYTLPLLERLKMEERSRYL